MFLKKRILCLSTIVIFICSFILYPKYSTKEVSNSDLTNSLDDKKVNGNIVDFNPPDINFISPNKCQQYIVGSPIIQATYNDDSGVDTSLVKLYVNYKDVTDKCNITEDKISYTPNKKFRRGTQVVKLEVSDNSENKNKKVFEWYFTVGTPVYNHYRGLLHSHTSASDGHGSYNDAYYMARDKANLDFFAITEHSNLLDNYKECNLNDGSSSEEWNNIILAKDKFTSNGNFIGLNGFEMTYNYNIENPIGHINIYNSEGFVTPYDDYLTLDKFYKLISSDENLIGQFNHPCDKFGKFDDFKYSSKGDKVISLLEVGNGYKKNINENIRAHDMYQMALDKGWHVGPTCNQDNHRVDFGIANEFRTVVLATDLTKDSIYDSLKKMRVYATEDKNLKIDYTVNDMPMGSTLRNTSKLIFSISAIDNDYNDKIKEILVISNDNKIIKSKKFDSNIAKLEFTIVPKENKFYYVKVIQNNDKISVTAPIWIKKR